MALVEEAIERARSATGMNIVLTGTTDDNRWEDREMNDPVLISWATAAENAHLAGDVAGVATSIWWELSPGVGRTMTGSIVLDLELFANPDVAKETKQAILLHEMAHVLGLGHVDDPDELMYYSALRTDYGPGDLEGLARIGNAPCD